jgi:hypothetical protein
VKASRRSFFAVLFAAALLSACTENGSTDDGQDATAQPTPTPTPIATATATVEPSVEPSPSPGTSSPRQTVSSPRQTISPTTVRLCDTKVESANPALRNVRFGRHDTYDRLAFDFCKPADTTLKATVVNQLIEDGSGKKVTLTGKYFIQITLTPADAHTDAGRPTVPSDAVTVAGRNMQQYKLIGDFEGVVTYGVGVRRLEETATALRADPDDPRHIIFYFDLGPQTG